MVDQIRISALIGSPVSGGRCRGRGLEGGALVDAAIRSLARQMYGRKLSDEQRAALLTLAEEK